MKSKFSKFLNFLTYDLWRLEIKELNFIKKIFVYFFRSIYLVVTGFLKDQCILRASALTYTTTLSIVPFLAVAFSISKGFGFQSSEYIRKFLLKISAGRVEVVEKIIEYINNTNVTTLGAIGVGTLIFTVISLLTNIEKAFNTIWGVTKGRSFGRKFADYISVTIVYPFLTIVAISSTATLQSSKFIQKILSISVIGNLYIVLLKLLPYISIWLALAFIYYFMPNTKVKFHSALIAGIIAGTLWQIAQIFYIKFQIGVSKYNAIYGSFAQIPLFLLWLYISWLIVLLGSEISFAIQNISSYKEESESLNVSIADKEKFAIFIMILIAKNFENGEKLLTNEEIAKKLNLPVKLVNDILFILEKSNLVIEIKKDSELYYSPAKPVDKINVYDIINSILNYGETKLDLNFKNNFKPILNLLEKSDKKLNEIMKNFNLKNILTSVKI